jgi:DNA-binding transcriptional MerR regulator
MSEQPKRVLVDTVSAAVAVDRPESTIRNWAHRGLIHKQGQDARRRSLYDLADVYRTSVQYPNPHRKP